MKKTRLGASGLEVTEYCLGTMTWGEQNSESEAHAQIAWALDRGINFIDTAEMYPVMAERHGLPLAAIALAFVRSRFFTASTILGATSVAQLEELGKHFFLDLTKEILSDLEAVHADCPSPAAQ
jgi:aryl-alcohol dehydrogenase-like predicted oxidoreductase